MRINHNIAALNTYSRLTQANTAQAKSLEKLSSGLRINRAGDDAAGLAISEKMRAQIGGLNQAARNSQDGISMVQTAEGALNETHSILQRMRELAVQSSNDTLVSDDREKIQAEIDQLSTEITRISNTTEFNNKNLLNGGLSSSTTNGRNITLQTGANEDQNLSFGIKAMDAFSLGVAGSSASVEASGDVTTASFTGTAAAIVNDNVITVATSEVFGGIVSGATNITGTTATSGGSVVTDAVISISTAIDNAATEGKSIGTTTYANIGAFNTALGDCSGTAKTITVKVDGGADQTITFDAAYGGLGAFADWGEVISLIEGDVAGVTATIGDGSSLTLTSASTGTASTVEVTDNDTLLGALTESAGAAADYSVSFDDGTTLVTVDGVAADAVSIDGTGAYATLSFNTGGIVDATTSGTITIGQTYTLTLSDTEGSTGTTITGLASTATTATGTGDFAGITFTLDGALADGESTNVTISAGAAATIAMDGTITKASASTGIDVSTRTAANNAITVLDEAITSVSEERGKLGAIQNRLEHTIANLSTTSENLTAAESRIRDVDMAKEMMDFTRNNILNQAATAMLAQANQMPQTVLQLLR